MKTISSNAISPAPWHLGVYNNVVAYDQGAWRTVATAAKPADRRLIVHAPELLACLKALVDEADLGEVDLEPEDEEKLEAARAVIAKVEGAK